MTVRGFAAAALAAVALAGCGSHAKPALNGPQRQGLLQRIALIRQSAVAGDLATTQRRLRGFRRAVADLERQGALDAPTAAALVTGATRALQRAPTDVVPPAPAQQAPVLPPGQAKKKDDKGPKPPGQDKKKHDKHGPGGGGGD